MRELEAREAGSYAMVKNWMQKRAGWKKVDVKDELLGSDEFGFMELEELDSTHLTKGM